MYRQTKISVSLGDSIGISLKFNQTAFEELLCISIKSVRSEIIAFKRRDSKIHVSQLMQKIGLGMEIIKHAMFLSLMSAHITFSHEVKRSIKELAFEVNALIEKMIEDNPDFEYDKATIRAKISKVEIKYITEKNW